MRPPGSNAGILYVVSSNFDKRYDFGLLTAVNLDAVALPAFGDQLDGGTVTVNDINVDAGSTILLADFGTNIATWKRPGGGERMFIISRAEGERLMAVDTSATNPLAMSCVQSLTIDGGPLDPPANPLDCGAVGASVVYNELSPSGVPRAPSPLAVAVSAAGEVWVTSAQNVDSPRGSAMANTSFVVHTPADLALVGGPPNRFMINDSNFQDIGPGPTDGVIVGQRWAYVTGRYTAAVLPNIVLLRLLDDNSLLYQGLEFEVGVPDARGIALASDEARAYIIGRLTPYVVGSDELVVASIEDPTAGMTGTTTVHTIRTVPLCDEPQEIVAIPRPGRSDLVAITCSGGAVAATGGASAAGLLVLYDDDVGDIVGQVPDLGLQPVNIAVDNRVTGARLFVSNFTDGRIAVIDIVDLGRPQDARLVGHLGRAQTCVTRNFTDNTCDGGTFE